MPDNIVIEIKTAGLEDLVKAESALDKITQSGTEMGNEFKKNSDAINAGIKQTTTSLGALQKAEQDLIAIQKTSTQPEILKQVNAELGKVRAEMKAAGQSADSLSKDFKKVGQAVNFEAGKKTLEEFTKNINNTVAGSQKLVTQLRAMKQELSAMDQAGQSGTKAFQKLSVEAAKLEDQIGDTARRIRTLASDTKNIDAVVGTVTALASAFSVAQGAAALLGGENQDLQKALLKVQAAMAIATGLQQLQNTLQKEGAVVQGFYAARTAVLGTITGLYTGATTLATVATAAWNRVLALNPIVAIATALTLAVAAIYQFVKGQDDAVDSTKALNEELQRQKKFVEDSSKAFDDAVQRSDEVVKTGSDNIINNIETEIRLAKIRGATLTEIFNLEKKLIDSRALLLKNSGNADTTEYNALLNQKKVLTAQYYADLKALAKKSNDDVKKITLDSLGGLGGDVSRIPEVVSAKNVEDFITLLAQQGAEARFIIRQEEATDQVNLDNQLKQQLLNTSIDFGNQLFAFSSAINSRQQQNLEDRLKAGQISEQKYAKEIAELKRKQAVADKEQAAFNIIINTAIAISKVAAQTGILATVLAVAIGALGAAQLATVLAQPIPQFAKGTENVTGGIKGKDSVLAMLMPGERIVPADINAKLGGIKNQDLPNLNLIPSMPYISDSTMTAMERARGVSATSNFKIDYDLLADKLSAKIEKHKKVMINIDERGFEKRVQEGLNTKKFWDDTFSYKG